MSETDRIQGLADLARDAGSLTIQLQNALAAATEVRDQAQAAINQGEARPQDTARIARWGEMLNTAMGQAQGLADTVDIGFRSYVREQENG